MATRVLRLPVVLVLLASCTPFSRGHVAFPILRSTWNVVLGDIARGGVPVTDAAKREIDKMSKAAQEDDTAMLAAVHWPTVRDAAIAGIEKQLTDGKISRGLADSSLETVKQLGLLRERIIR